MTPPNCRISTPRHPVAPCIRPLQEVPASSTNVPSWWIWKTLHWHAPHRPTWITYLTTSCGTAQPAPPANRSRSNSRRARRPSSTSTRNSSTWTCRSDCPEAAPQSSLLLMDNSSSTFKMIHDINFISLSYFIVCKINVSGKNAALQHTLKTHWFEETELKNVRSSKSMNQYSACEDCYHSIYIVSSSWLWISGNPKNQDKRVLMTPCESARPRLIILICFVELSLTTLVAYILLSNRVNPPMTVVNTHCQWMLCCHWPKVREVCDTGWLIQATIHLLGINVWFRKAKQVKNRLSIRKQIVRC